MGQGIVDYAVCPLPRSALEYTGAEQSCWLRVKLKLLNNVIDACLFFVQAGKFALELQRLLQLLSIDSLLNAVLSNNCCLRPMLLTVITSSVRTLL